VPHHAHRAITSSRWAAATLLAATVLCAHAAPAPAQRFDISGNLIPRHQLKAAHDSLIAITVHPLSKGVYAALNRFVWNGWIELPQGILVVDGGYDARSATALADTIRARSGPRPIRYLVVTSGHTEHIGGVRTFSALGATVLAHPTVIAAIRDSLPEGAKAQAESSLVLDPAGRRVEIRWLGHPANSAGDLIVYLPKQKVLFTGDLAWYRKVPWLVDPKFSYTGWLATLDTLLTPRFQVDSLVPGHGTQIPSKIEGLMFTRRYLWDAYRLAESRVSWNAQLKDVFGWGDLGAYEEFQYYDPVHYYNMRRLFQLAKGIPTPGRVNPGVIPSRRDVEP
jgi:glyoxylase-like metal-dependent hydrolase (beta-lactamase superfamily II)